MQPDIICRKCKTPKQPCLYRPSDLVKGRLICRQCKKEEQQRHVIMPSGKRPGHAWRRSMREIFVDAVAAGRAL